MDGMKRILLPVAIFLAALSCGAPALAAGPWQVLVHDQVAKPGKDKAARWATYWADSVKSKRLDGAALSLSGHLYLLKIVSESKRDTCPKGKFPFSYAIDQLVAEPLGAGDAITLAGQSNLASARDLLRDHVASCDGIKSLPGRPDSTESYERMRLGLVGTFGDYLGIEQVSESFPFTRPKPVALADWSCYRYRDEDLWKAGKKVLPDGALAEAQARFNKLGQTEKDPYSPPDFSHFVMAPSAGGVAIEFAVPGTSEGSQGTVKVVRVDVPKGLKDEYGKTVQAFVAAHPKLVDWARATFYTVAPDQSAVVYVLNGNLYWQPATGKARVVGPVKSVRGFQWQDARKLDDRERQVFAAN